MFDCFFPSPHELPSFELFEEGKLLDVIEGIPFN
jgi:hypothetical protein